MTRAERHKAIVKRRIFIAVCVCILAALILLIAFVIKSAFGGKKTDGSDVSQGSSSAAGEIVSDVSSEDPTPSYPATGPNGLDANYEQLLLVNAQNPLPENYDYEGSLTEIPTKYINGMLKQIDKNVWPYMQAMIDAQRATQTDSKNWLYVRSPYRSYKTQKMLFDNETKKWLATGLSSEAAEAKAATVVTRPGTSEHNTGFSADFNIAEDSFESTPMFTWMQEHAADYGFVLRFPKDKQEKTGIVYESWHYRYVGEEAAKFMKENNLCLEEFVELAKAQQEQEALKEAEME